MTWKDYEKLTMRKLEGRRLIVLHDLKSKGGTEIKSGEHVICTGKGNGFHIVTDDGRSMRRVDYSSLNLVELD